MSPPTARDVRFVTHLEQFLPGERPGKPPRLGDRAALAALRRGLGNAPGETPDMYPYVVAAIPREVGPDQEAPYYLVASLFALHPNIRSRDDAPHANLGDSMAQLSHAVDGDGPERRFVALLNAPIEPLDAFAQHLRHAVSLLRAHDIVIDWAQLLTDIRHWPREHRPVQQAWARSFWTYRPQDTQVDSDASDGEAVLTHDTDDDDTDDE